MRMDMNTVRLAALRTALGIAMGVLAAGAMLACDVVAGDSADASSKPADNVIGCLCAWKTGVKGEWKGPTGNVTCQGPWSATSNLEVDKNTAVDACIARAKAQSSGPAYSCICACDPDYVAGGTSATALLCADTTVTGG
ncbi:MAG: hypothetical protein HY902_19740 [Deltaproteobacteria bacterium]|nr:hypothetical protein [Deltaproteobacteria bacterium]